MARRSEWSEVDDISLELKESLNIPNLRPFLRVTHLLTETELEQVQISPANPREQAIDRFVSILKTKGPRHPERFLQVLKLSLQQDDYHLGHEHLSERLAEVICERKRGNEFEVEALVQVHPPAGYADSGLGGGSHNSSQEASSPGSTQSESFLSRSSGCDPFNYRSKAIRGLDKLENEPVHGQGLDECQVSSLRHKIVTDTYNITSCFAVMVLGLYRLLKQNNAPVDEVKIMLQFLGCHPASSQKNTTLFSGSDEISTSKDLKSLIECLRKYSSWYNYRLMKVVADQFAGEDGKKLISDYEDDLRAHYVKLIAYQCPEFSLEKGMPPGYTRLIVKVDWDYRSTTLQEIATFQANLADILELEPYVFQLRRVDEGCVRFEWSIPAALEPYVSRMMVAKQECLKESRVLSVEITSSRIEIDKQSLPPNLKSRTSSNGSMVLPRTPRKTTLSQSSSIVSILDVPMSTTEAELLSLYDSGGSIDGESRSSKTFPTSPIAENPTECSPQIVNSGSETQQEEASAVEENVALDETPVTVCSPITRAYCSEGDLLCDSTHCTLRYGKEGLSLPDISRNAMPTTSRGCNIKFCRQRSSVVKNLRKLSVSIMNLLRPSRRRNREERRDDNGYTTSPQRKLPLFPLLEFSDEPRKLGGNRPKTLPSPFSPKALPNVYTPLILPQPNVSIDGSETARIADPALPQTDDRRGSAISYSPATTPTPDVITVAMNSDYRRSSFRDSGVGGSFNSTHSNSRQHSGPTYTRQTSSDSVDTASVSSVSTVPSKRNSYSSHHYINLGFPIHEEPSSDVTTLEEAATQNKRGGSVSLPQYPPPERKYPPEKYELQNRSHSHGEEYYHRVHPNSSKLPPSSPQHSSGYASYASSLAQSVDMCPSQSQESISSSGVKSPLFPASHRSPTVGPFASRPPVPGKAQVNRSGSLKATVTYQVSRYHK